MTRGICFRETAQSLRQRFSPAHRTPMSGWPCQMHRRRCRLDEMHSILLKRRLRWFGHVAERKESWSEICWWRNTFGLADEKRSTGEILECHFEGGSPNPTVFGFRHWNRDWIAISCELTRSWAAAFSDAVKAQEDTSTARLRWMMQVQTAHKRTMRKDLGYGSYWGSCLINNPSFVLSTRYTFIASYFMLLVHDCPARESWSFCLGAIHVRAFTTTASVIGIPR